MEGCYRTMELVGKKKLYERRRDTDKFKGAPTFGA